MTTSHGEMPSSISAGPGYPETIKVSVVESLGQRQINISHLVLPQGSTVKQALVAIGQGDRIADAPVGVWGRKVAVTQQLFNGDRLELYRPLLVDPKRARRERFKKQGQGVTGLFARTKKPANPSD